MYIFTKPTTSSSGSEGSLGSRPKQLPIIKYTDRRHSLGSRGSKQETPAKRSRVKIWVTHVLTQFLILGMDNNPAYYIIHVLGGQPRQLCWYARRLGDCNKKGHQDEQGGIHRAEWIAADRRTAKASKRNKEVERCGVANGLVPDALMDGDLIGNTCAALGGYCQTRVLLLLLPTILYHLPFFSKRHLCTTGGILFP